MNKWNLSSGGKGGLTYEVNVIHNIYRTRNNHFIISVGAEKVFDIKLNEIPHHFIVKIVIK